jgi:beta-glucuronidase
MGFMVWEENHARGLSEAQMQHARFREQCASCNEEMVSQHANHPSIVIWGILNECITFTDYGRACYAEQFAQLRALDTSRPFTTAGCYPTKDEVQDLVDVSSWNVYPGWYSGQVGADNPVEAIDLIFEHQAGKGIDGKPFILSEFGAGAIPGYRDPCRRSKWSEDRQADILKEQLNAFYNHPRVCGVFIWQFCDVRVDEVTALSRPRCMNNKGVVDEFRRRKLSFEIVKNTFSKDR